MTRMTEAQHRTVAGQLQQVLRDIEAAEDLLRRAKHTLIAAHKPQQAFKAKTILSGLNNLASNAAASYRYHSDRTETTPA